LILIVIHINGSLLEESVDTVSAVLTTHTVDAVDGVESLNGFAKLAVHINFFEFEVANHLNDSFPLVREEVGRSYAVSVVMFLPPRKRPIVIKARGQINWSRGMSNDEGNPYGK